MRNSIAATAVLLASTLTAQTFIVDAAGGPGTHFTSIVAAVASVPDGAVLQVRPGNYATFTIDNKSLTVLGDPGVVVTSLAGIVAVSNLGMSQHVVLRGLELRGVLASGRYQCTNCLGLVALDSCRSPLTSGTGCALEATGCAQLRLVDCEFAGPYVAKIALYGSHTSLVRVRVPFSAPTPGILQQDGTSELIDCEIHGHPVTNLMPPLLFLTPGSARLLGTTQLVNNQLPAFANAAIQGPGTVLADPAVQLLTFATPPIGPTTSLVVREMPAVRASSAPLGGVQSASMSGPTGGVGGLFADWPTPATIVAPFAEPLFVDLTTAVAMANGAFGGPLAGSYAVPAVPSLLATRIAWQGWSYDSLNGFQAGNAVVVTHW